MDKNDGGPAFPVVVHRADSGAHVANLGMSLRAYIATAALQALIAKHPRELQDAGYFDGNADSEMSAMAVIYADALLAELAK